MRVCPRCAEEAPDRYSFCGVCGSSLATPAARETSRKTVTVVFTDLKGSTNLGEQLDSESLWEVLSVYFDAMKTVLERHGGTVEKYIGDAIMAVFGLAEAHEDDAQRAVRAAFEMRLALAEVNEQLTAGWGVALENRTGVHTGEVVTGDPTAGERLVTGDTVNVAARLEQAAPAREVLIAARTHELVAGTVEVEEVEPLALKGKSEPVRAWRLLGVHAGEAIKRRVDTPIVGRETELAALTGAFREAVEGRTCRLVTVLAHAGLGKSRLVAELVRTVKGEATVLVGRCPSYGDGVTFWPVAEIFRQAAGVTADDPEERARLKLSMLAGGEREDAADRVASVTGLSDARFELDEVMWAVRSLLELLARRRPVVVVFDDIHWAAPTLLDLIESIADSSSGAPLLVLCAARHELLEHRPAWMEDRDRAARLVLSELSSGEGAVVVKNLLGDGVLPLALEERIVHAADGNPLFVEQMVSKLIDDRVLVGREDGTWEFDATAEVSVPPSISALLTARLDRLGRHERAVVECGSVIGQVFYPRAVEALGGGDGPTVAQAISSLVSKRVLADADPDLAGEDAYRFSHVLVRDAAYRRLLKRTRALLHDRFGQWLAEVAGSRMADYEEIVGYHFEQSFVYSAGLGQVDERVRAVGDRASRHLRSAGERALGLGDLPAGASLLRRSADVLAEEDPLRPALLLEVGDAAAEMGELEAAAGALDEAVERAGRSGDRELETSARLTRLAVGYSTDPQRVEARVVEEAERAIAEFEAADRHDVLARAWRLLMRVHWHADAFGAAEAAIERTIEHAEAQGDHVRARRGLGGLAICAVYGPRPVAEAAARCEEVLARVADDRKVTAVAQCSLARLEAMRGNFPRARDLYRQSRGTLQQLGWALLAAMTSIDSGPIEMLAGDFEAAVRELRGDYESLQRMGEQNYISTVAGWLASALYELGRTEEADELTSISSRLGAPDDVSTQVLWRCVRSKLLARQGLAAEAETLAREAVDVVDRTDYIDAQGTTRVALATVHELSGDAAAASAALREAAERFERKGNVVAAGAARERLEALSAPLPLGS